MNANKTYQIIVKKDKEKKFEECLRSEYAKKLTVKTLHYRGDYCIYKLAFNNITPKELEDLQNKFLG